MFQYKTGGNRLSIMSLMMWGFYYSISLKNKLFQAWYNYSCSRNRRMNINEYSAPSLFLSSELLMLRIAMKNLTKHLLILFVATLCFQKPSQGQIILNQSMLNPTDSVMDYDSLNKPVQPFYGQIGKWVRTPRTYFGWNTNSYKAYIYKGIAFRIKFPKTYNPNVNDGKKYPMLVFWHGLGEKGDLFDNEFHLWLGCKMFRDAVDNGTFDGYVIAMQTLTELSGFFGSSHYQAMKEIIDYMVVNNKLDPFRVVNNGLSSGGIASMNMFLENPTYMCGIVTMSPPGNYTAPDLVNKEKFTPIWYANGGLDNNPTPGAADYNKYILDSAGADFKRKTYPLNYHNTWDATWAEPDFWPFVNKAYASNPHALYNKTEFVPGEAVNTTIGLPPGFNAYEWRKDGILIPGATTNSIVVNQLGTYDARVLRGTLWSDWSKIPVQLYSVMGPSTRIEAENFTNMFGIKVETTSDYGGGQNIGYQDYNDWLDYSINVPAAASYTFKFRIAAQFSDAQFQIRQADGTILSTITVPSTGGFQYWQNVSATFSLPAGQQTLRILTTVASGGWNFNWFEYTLSGTVLPPPLNKPPVANSGVAQTITLPTSSVQLSGSGTDADGTIASYNWTQVAGPSTATLSTPNAALTTASALVQGTYTFRLTVTDNQNSTGSSDVNVTVNGAASSSVRIEAENFSAMFGIQVETTTDTGGGQDVGYQDNNDWMDYPVNLSTAGTYTASFRVASINTGAQFQLRKSDGTILSTITVPNTGGWQTWQTVSVSVTLPAGQQTLRIVTTAASGGWNINWFDLNLLVTPPPSTIRIEAENYSNMLGVLLENTTDTGGGKDVTGQDINDWMDYSVSLPSAGLYTVRFRVAHAGKGAQFALYNQSGSVLKTIAVPTTGGNQVWQTITTTISLPAGQQFLRIATNISNGGWNLNWMEFVPPVTTTLSVATTEIVPEVRTTAAVEVFPNPAVGGFQLVLNNEKTGKVQVQIVNISGAVVKRFDLNKSSAGIEKNYISINELQRGTYMVNIRMNGWMESKRMIKQ